MSRSKSSSYSFSFFCVNFGLLKMYSSKRSKDKREMESLAAQVTQGLGSTPLQYSVVSSEPGGGASPQGVGPPAEAIFLLSLVG